MDISPADAFQAEKRTIFSTEWLPLCAEGQVARPGDFFSATVGGWAVVAVRDNAGAVRVLRNACRHQNMPVVGTPKGSAESFRCRFHGWTYDLQGKFVSAPPMVAPQTPTAEHDLVALATAREAGLLFFSLATPAGPASLGALPAYAGTIATDINANWKVALEHLLANGHELYWPLLAVRRAGAATIVEQVVPHTFMRTRLLTHVFGGDNIDERKQAAAAIKQFCEAGPAKEDLSFRSKLAAALA